MRNAAISKAEDGHTFNLHALQRPDLALYHQQLSEGQAPVAFDLLYWNSDATRLPAANHAFYLRSCYLENNLARGKMKIAGKRSTSGR
jgi:poly(3-hydroxyalkanoate) synthetase